jgi:3-hydroxymyristoyl/3-hydroxydecanoyl-(acyl carrier protein) dehydratase
MNAVLPLHKLPVLVQTAIDVNRVTLTLHVPNSLAFFPGHFPVHAILPGVVQIDWAIHFARQHFPLLPQFRKMEALKFQAIIEPEQQISLVLEHKPESGKILFSYDSDRGRHSSGRIVFAQDLAVAS